MHDTDQDQNMLYQVCNDGLAAVNSILFGGNVQLGVVDIITFGLVMVLF